MFSLDTCCHSEDTRSSIVDVFLVNSCCLKRGATTLLFLNTVKLKNSNRLVSIKLFKKQPGKRTQTHLREAAKVKARLGLGDSYECFE